MNFSLKKFRGYFLNIILISLVLYVYKKSSYYSSLLEGKPFSLLFYFLWVYIILGFLYYLFISKEKITETRGSIFFDIIYRILSNPLQFIKNKLSLEKKEKTTLLFLIVKIFFLPLMLNFTFNNYNSIINQLPKLSLESFFSINSFNSLIFPFALTLIFFLDTAFFAFGYLFESRALKNKVRSVEPTFLGWFVALICYPPFNTYLTNYAGWSADEYILFSTPLTTLIFRILIILLLIIYVSATLYLGTKCSNLTNRGIVSRGPYSIIRHPAYISKNLAWWITLIPIFSWWAFTSMFIWSLIYHLRTITEEVHLSKDPDYVEYCKKVKYRYIPFVY